MFKTLGYTLWRTEKEQRSALPVKGPWSGARQGNTQVPYRMLLGWITRQPARMVPGPCNKPRGSLEPHLSVSRVAPSHQDVFWA